MTPWDLSAPIRRIETAGPWGSGGHNDRPVVGSGSSLIPIGAYNVCKVDTPDGNFQNTKGPLNQRSSLVTPYTGTAAGDILFVKFASPWKPSWASQVLYLDIPGIDIFLGSVFRGSQAQIVIYGQLSPLANWDPTTLTWNTMPIANPGVGAVAGPQQAIADLVVNVPLSASATININTTADDPNVRRLYFRFGSLQSRVAVNPSTTTSFTLSGLLSAVGPQLIGNTIRFALNAVDAPALVTTVTNVTDNGDGTLNVTIGTPFAAPLTTGNRFYFAQPWYGFALGLQTFCTQVDPANPVAPYYATAQIPALTLPILVHPGGAVYV